MNHANAGMTTSSKAAIPENIERLRMMLCNMGEQIARLEASADNLGGSTPAESSKPPQPCAVPNGHVGVFIEALDDVSRLSNRLATVADRFSNLV